MNSNDFVPLAGGCTCGQVRYKVTRPPLFVHGCHCTWCQRETGSAFAINAMIERSEVKLTNEEPQLIDLPSASGRGQKVARCTACQVALWGHYGGMGEWLAFIKVGTLDEANLLPPDVHIYTESKQHWVSLTDGKPVFEQYYDAKALWPEETMARFQALKKLSKQHG